MPLPLLIPLLASTAGQVAGTVMSAMGNNKRQRELNLRQRRLDQWYNSEYNKDYLDNIEAKSGLRTVMEHIKRQGKAADNTAAMMGSSDESQVANKEQQGRTYADFVNNLAARGQNRRDNIQNSYMGQKNYLDQSQDALTAEKQQTAANIASNAGNILSSASSAASIGAFDKAPVPGTTDWSSLANKRLATNQKLGLLKGNTIQNNGRAIPLLNQ